MNHLLIFQALSLLSNNASTSSPPASRESSLSGTKGRFWGAAQSPWDSEHERVCNRPSFWPPDPFARHPADLCVSSRTKSRIVWHESWIWKSSAGRANSTAWDIAECGCRCICLMPAGSADSPGAPAASAPHSSAPWWCSRRSWHSICPSAPAASTCWPPGGAASKPQAGYRRWNTFPPRIPWASDAKGWPENRRRCQSDTLGTGQSNQKYIKIICRNKLLTCEVKTDDKFAVRIVHRTKDPRSAATWMNLYGSASPRKSVSDIGCRKKVTRESWMPRNPSPRVNCHARVMARRRTSRKVPFIRTAYRMNRPGGGSWCQGTRTQVFVETSGK